MAGITNSSIDKMLKKSIARDKKMMKAGKKSFDDAMKKHRKALGLKPKAKKKVCGAFNLEVTFYENRDHKN